MASDQLKMKPIVSTVILLTFLISPALLSSIPNDLIQREQENDSDSDSSSTLPNQEQDHLVADQALSENHEFDSDSNPHITEDQEIESNSSGSLIDMILDTFKPPSVLRDVRHAKPHFDYAAKAQKWAPVSRPTRADAPYASSGSTSDSYPGSQSGPSLQQEYSGDGMPYTLPRQMYPGAIDTTYTGEELAQVPNPQLSAGIQENSFPSIYSAPSYGQYQTGDPYPPQTSYDASLPYSAQVPYSPPISSAVPAPYPAPAPISDGGYSYPYPNTNPYEYGAGGYAGIPIDAYPAVNQTYLSMGPEVNQQLPSYPVLYGGAQVDYSTQYYPGSSYYPQVPQACGSGPLSPPCSAVPVVPLPPQVIRPPSYIQPEPIISPPQYIQLPPIVRPPQIIQSPPIIQPPRVIESPPIVNPPKVIDSPPIYRPPQIIQPPPIYRPAEVIQPPPIRRPPQVIDSPPIYKPPEVIQSPPIIRPPEVITSPPIVRPPQIIQSPPIIKPPQVVESPPIYKPPEIIASPPIYKPPEVITSPPIIKPPQIIQSPPIYKPPEIITSPPIIKPPEIITSRPIIRPPEIITSRPIIKPPEIITSRPIYQKPQIIQSPPIYKPPEIITSAPIIKLPEVITSRPIIKPPEIITSRPIIRPPEIITSRPIIRPPQIIQSPPIVRPPVVIQSPPIYRAPQVITRPAIVRPAQNICPYSSCLSAGICNYQGARGYNQFCSSHNSCPGTSLCCFGQSSLTPSCTRPYSAYVNQRTYRQIQTNASTNVNTTSIELFIGGWMEEEVTTLVTEYLLPIKMDSSDKMDVSVWAYSPEQRRKMSCTAQDANCVMAKLLSCVVDIEEGKPLQQQTRSSKALEEEDTEDLPQQRRIPEASQSKILSFIGCVLRSLQAGMSERKGSVLLATKKCVRSYQYSWQQVRHCASYHQQNKNENDVADYVVPPTVPVELAVNEVPVSMLTNMTVSFCLALNKAGVTPIHCELLYDEIQNEKITSSENLITPDDERYPVELLINSLDELIEKEEAAMRKANQPEDQPAPEENTNDVSSDNS